MTWRLFQETPHSHSIDKCGIFFLFFFFFYLPCCFTSRGCIGGCIGGCDILGLDSPGL